jgi:hypothetical protein
MRGACGGRISGPAASAARLPAGCGPAECCGCCLGGGRLGGAEAALKQMQPNAAKANGPTVRILCKQVINSPKSRSKCEIRIWFRLPSAARSKCRKIEFNVSARYLFALWGRFGQFQGLFWPGIVFSIGPRFPRFRSRAPSARAARGRMGAWGAVGCRSFIHG